MEPVRIRQDVDPNSREYRRNLIIVIGILLFLTVTGGTILGYKIRTAENAKAASEAAAESGERTAEQKEKDRAMEILREKK
ncbi:hypothetical protein FIV42_14310 [Persicimonas caeni]|jgi:hypothetical protein|uniref:Uncharacterized protein n=1 Tax=Persicimonas caeni TaxID=2292766 RepID=A0A4Y6PUE9_PERCE|nr:hypothetical protein [Persicimonas caeni]QDG51870.1 hypothetical protein FIV42_14310 [Persicimonas caeni]QED33091.1 hypothetical protein FRD00_14305 [Persicimonas caeni]